MRVTSKMMVNNINLEISMQSELLLKTQKVIASQKKVQRASDDPIAMGKILNYRESISSIDQYMDNIIQGKTRFEFSETIFDSAMDLSARAKNISVNESSGTYETRQAAAVEIQNIRDQIVSLANSKMGENYLFSGHQTDTPAFSHHVEISGGVAANIDFGLAADATDTTIDIKDASGSVVRTITQGDFVTPASGGTMGANSVVWNGLDTWGALLPDGSYTFEVNSNDSNAGVRVIDYETYNGDSGDIEMMMGDGVNLKVNVDGNTAFTDLFYRLSRLQQGLEDPNLTNGTIQISGQVNALEAAHDQIAYVRSEGASKYNRLEVSESQYDKLKINIQDMLSDEEDADMATAIMELQSMQAAYETTLATAAKIIQPSLVDFLR